MLVYSIKDVENLSGVKAHTIRIWEKRYDIVNPKRTETNIRFYDEEDLKLVLQIALLKKSGMKISKIASLSRDEISQLCAEVNEVQTEFENSLDTLTLSLIELDEQKFNRIFDLNIQDAGFEKTMEEIIFPLLNKLSVMWMTGSIKQVHEHFVGNLIKRKIISEIDKLSGQSLKEEKFLVFLNEKEDHELSILFLHYLLKKKGFKVLNIGTNVGVNNLIEGSVIYKPNYLITIINEEQDKVAIEQFIHKTCEAIHPAVLLVSGFQAARMQINKPDNCQIVSDLNSIKEFYHNL